MAVEFNDNGLWDERERNKAALRKGLESIFGVIDEVAWDKILEVADEFADEEHRRVDAYNTAEAAMRGGLG